MYSIPPITKPNVEPWLLPLQQRTGMVREASRAGKKVALMMYRAADTSTFRYRCYNVMQYTESSERWQTVYFYRDEEEVFLSLLPLAALCILARLKWDHGVDGIAVRAHELGIPLLYDIDDYVCDIKYLKTVTNTLGVPFPGEVHYDFWFADISRLEAAAALCDGFLTTNDYLGGMLSAKFGKPYRVIRNTLNREQLLVSGQCLRHKDRAFFKKPFTIGYFSGTPSHINDFRTVAPELAMLLDEFPELRLSVVGFMEFPEYMKKHLDRGQVTFTPLVDFLELQRLIAGVDVNIVPLVQNAFTNCKSELKFFEASVVGTVTVAAPIYTYRTAIRHGENGYLCEQGEWYGCLKNLYLDRRNTAPVVERAYEDSLAVYSGENVLRGIEAAYDFFAALSAE